jgi:uncharacterized protein (DUF934 family)
MNPVIVTDAGFGPDTYSGNWLDLPPDASPEALRADLSRIPAIRVAFPVFSDGRGFTIASLLRRLGFAGRLRASGHVIADQYAMARRAGFDEIEIPLALAARQPEDQWLARANWQANDYRQAFLRRAPG